MTKPAVDVAVIGGGPAGATAARLLREWGHAVVLLHRPAGPPLAVSIPPSTRKILAAVGALPWIEGHGFLRTTGNTSWWGTEEPRVESFSAEDGATGFQVLGLSLSATFDSPGGPSIVIVMSLAAAASLTAAGFIRGR